MKPTSKSETYREKLKSIEDWDEYLRAESGLPGPRGNLELAGVVADEGDPARFERYLAHDAAAAPVNSPDEFLAFCGAVGLGRLLAEGRLEVLPVLRRCASDPRWRMREGVAMALQRWGEADMDALVEAMRDWAAGAPLEQRAAAAALCEPRLLKQAKHSRAVLEILDAITGSVHRSKVRGGDAFPALKKGLGYCWSVAATAAPVEGRKRMEKWMAVPDKDIRWIMKENLKKNRLKRIDPAWVEHWQAVLVGEGS